MNDIIINKIQSIHRCIERAKEEYTASKENFEKSVSNQDAAVLNILRACEQAIDLANHIIKIRKLGIPTSSTESFELLAKKHIIPPQLYDKLKQMVGFRNKAIHEYQGLEIKIVIDIINTKLDDLITFTEIIQDLGIE